MRPCSARALRGGLLAGLLLVALCCAPAPPPVRAGEAIRVGGPNFGNEGQYFVWNTTNISYTVDGGMLGTLANMVARQTMVLDMFSRWEAVLTSSISFSMNPGPITAASSANCVPDGDVNSITEFNCLSMNGFPGNPIIFDVDGSLVAALGLPNNSVLGFAGPQSNSLGFHTAGMAVLNGRFIDGVNTPPGNRETTVENMQAAALHEYGHFIGLGHSQINDNCFTNSGQPGNTCTNFSDDSFGIPTMYPLALPILEAPNTPPELTLALDDIAWVSLLYPAAAFNTTHGFISGTLFTSDSLSAIQGGNIIARQVDDPATPIDESGRCAVSVVSGERYTGNAGQGITGDNATGSLFGSRDPLLFGSYRVAVPVNPAGLGPAACAAAATTGTFTVEVESINGTFTDSSGVGPNGNTVGEVIPIPGPAEFHSGAAETNSDSAGDTATPVVVTAGNTASGINIVLDGTPNTNDAFEGAGRNDTVATATAIGVGTTSASISPVMSSGPDIDVYGFTAIAGQALTFNINARTLAPMSFLDPVLEIVDNGGMRVNLCRATAGSGLFTAACLNDDEVPGMVRDSILEFQSSSAGTFFVRVLDWTGGARADFRYDLVVTVGTADFALSANPTAVTVARGQSGMSTITATPMNGSFGNAITFSCSGLPAQSACVFNPTSVTPGANPATTQLSITTTAPAMIPSAPQSYRWPLPPVYVLALTLLALLLFAAGVTLKRTRAPAWLLGGGAGWGGRLSTSRAEARRYIAPRNRAVARACHVAAVLTLVGLAVACGGGGGGGATPPPPNQGTPTGTFSVTVRGTAGAIQRTTVVTLTVQ